MKPNPRLIDIILTWMKTELPKAKFKSTSTVTDEFTIMKGKRECFKVTCSKVDWDPENYMRIHSSHVSNLEELITIKHDRVVFGKWGDNVEILAADPEFFQKMTMYMTRAAIVVTMGDFVPNIPKAKNVEI